MEYLSTAILFLGTTLSASAASPELTPETIEKNMQMVAEWQVAHPKRHNHLDWTYGAFYAGMAAYGNMNPDGIGFKTIRKLGEEREWGHLGRFLHADDHTIGQAWLEIAVYDKNPAAMKQSQALLDRIIKHNSQVSIEFGKPKNQDRWSWADALFMSPTVFVKMAGYTGDKKYLEFADREYKNTYDYLYDKEDNLFFRDSRYFNTKTATGKKMFWSRGNGWVFAGLPIILRDLPKDWPTRKFYEDLFKRMAVSMKKSQQPDGSWYPSLHDPTDPAIKEMSATNFINYGLIWGINNGYLSEEEYFPVVKKAWEVTCGAINDEGALGWVQPIADKPGNYSKDSTEVYASGAFLMTAAELRKYVIGKMHKGIRTVTVENPDRIYRPSETVSVSWNDLKMNKDKLRVLDFRNGRVIDHQIIDSDGDGSLDTLLFQGDIFAGATRKFWIFESDTLPPAKNETVCYSRVVKERMDDMAWENDVTAHRMYGPTVAEKAPKGEGLVSGGIDVWSKKVRTPVLDKFYKAGNYHADHGEGMDWYKVGTGPGCGGIAYFSKDNVYPSRNWSTARVLYNGPVRTAFEVAFAPLEVGNNAKISEKRIVTLDAGSFFTKSESTFTLEGQNPDLKVGVGLDYTKNQFPNAQTRTDTQGKTYALKTMWGTDPENGSLGTAIFLIDKPMESKNYQGDPYLVTPVRKDKKFIRYSGATWDRNGIITNGMDWGDFCGDAAKRVVSPVKTTISGAK